MLDQNISLQFTIVNQTDILSSLIIQSVIKVNECNWVLIKGPSSWHLRNWWNNLIWKICEKKRLYFIFIKELNSWLKFQVLGSWYLPILFVVLSCFDFSLHFIKHFLPCFRWCIKVSFWYIGVWRWFRESEQCTSCSSMVARVE